jgi:hypothetical protein
MAKATFTPGYAPPPPPREPSKINLELTAHEAATLIVVLRSVGGSGACRNDCDSILRSMNSCALIKKLNLPDFESKSFHKSGNIFFSARRCDEFVDLVAEIEANGFDL